MGKTKKIAISIVAIMLIIGIPLLMFYVKIVTLIKCIYMKLIITKMKLL